MAFEEEVDDKNISETELSKIPLMRAFVESKDPSAKEYDDLTIRRFLRARELDIEKASSMFLEFLKWRSSFVPNGSISLSEVPDELAQNKMFMQGFDKKGRPITVVFGARHFQNKVGGLDEFKRFVVYSLDKLCSRMPTGEEKFVGIGDLKGWGYSNCDIRGYLGALKILQIVFVENSTLKSRLQEDIEEDQLPETYGGKMPLVPIQNC
ncbi:uncharacterized protein LOC129320988 isoform X2 [Prosopis cineraria]|uniref:uncharacterized protein LOC129320988 isoform X2 n=1 Tax=Prosopis cineraria TaxID=364024 RepID=UPI00241067FF|nr:uncharacterized protein LOC129320988 isoform X2 [Prosopis cineraria]